MTCRLLVKNVSNTHATGDIISVHNAEVSVSSSIINALIIYRGE